MSQPIIYNKFKSGNYDQAWGFAIRGINKEGMAKVINTAYPQATAVKQVK